MTERRKRIVLPEETTRRWNETDGSRREEIRRALQLVSDRQEGTIELYAFGGSELLETFTPERPTVP